MITIQEAHKYINLAKDGLTKKILCGNDSDHTSLLPSLNEQDEVYFYCLGCTYKITPGYKMERYIRFVLDSFTIKS